MFPFRKVFENETDTVFNYESYTNQLNIYQSKYVKERNGLKVEDINCYRDLIELLNESKMRQKLKFEIDYLKEKFFGSINAKLNFVDTF